MSIAPRKQWFPFHGRSCCPALLCFVLVLTDKGARAVESGLQVEPPSMAHRRKARAPAARHHTSDADGSLRDVTRFVVSRSSRPESRRSCTAGS